MIDFPLVLRALRSDEFPLVYASWIKPLRHLNDIEHAQYKRNPKSFQHPPVDKRIWCKGLHNKISNILAHPATSTLCAELGDGVTIVGFIVVQPYNDLIIVHWLSVKAQFRRHGIGALLLSRMVSEFGMNTDNLKIVAGSRTNLWRCFAKGLKLNWTFDPFSVEV